MSQQPVTASALISFATDLEARSESFYRELAASFPDVQAAFAGFAQDCAKSSKEVLRTYQETVTDALETGYSLEGLNLGVYGFEMDVLGGTSRAEALTMALELETLAADFYQDVAERSERLLATIPRAFKRAARTRRRRRVALAALRDGNPA